MRLSGKALEKFIKNMPKLHQRKSECCNAELVPCYSGLVTPAIFGCSICRKVERKK